MRRTQSECAVPAVCALLLLAFIAIVGTAEAATPVSLGEIQSFLLIGKPDTEIAAEIQSRGVAFPVTRDLLAQLRSKGVGSETLAVLRSRLSGPILMLKVQPGESEAVIDGGSPRKTNSSGIARIGGLTPGKHGVLLRKPGFKDWSGSVTLSAGEETVVEQKLLPGPAMIEWSTDVAGASVTIDDREVSWKVGAPVEVEPGHHVIVFGCPACEPVRHELTISPGERRRVDSGLTVNPQAVAVLRESLLSARDKKDFRTGAEIAKTLTLYLPDDPAAVASLAEGCFLNDEGGRFVELGKKAIVAGETVRIPVRHRDTKITAEMFDAILEINAKSVVFEPLHEPCGWEDRAFELARFAGVRVDSDDATMWLSMEVLLPGEKKPKTVRFADRSAEFEPARRVKSLGGVLAFQYTGRNMTTRTGARESLSAIRDLLSALVSEKSSR
ncbi:MAG: PEGA domain-containing protein [Holophagales bacterium]|nr:MAG: PEGA domain-containing protein [Holophagales bacterium]